jgi:lactoylglutathione lyase
MLRVGNLDKSIDFYVNGLGMDLIRRKDYPHGEFTLAFVGYGSEKENSVIELTHNWGKKSEDYELGDKYGHIAIGVKDIYRICKSLEENGIKITTKPKTMKNSSTVLAFVEDPDGYKIELIERD